MTLEQLRREREKLKGKPAGDKLWYIWAYYKIPILIGIAVIFLICQAVGAIARSRQECMLYLAFIDQSYSGERETDNLKEDFYANQGFSGHQTVTFDTSINLSDASFKNASEIMLQSLLGTDTLDAVITKEDIVQEYAERGNVWLNLDSVLSEEMSGELASEIYYAPDLTGNDVPTGLLLRRSKLVSAYGMDEDSVLCICNMENHPEVVLDFIRFIFEIQ